MKIIIHISDLHVSLYLNNDESVKNDINSYLTTDDNLDKSSHYITTFLNKMNVIKDDYQDPEFILLVTGDIANAGEPKEYKFAHRLLKKIIDEYQIPPSNLLIIPGDHDVSRRSLNNYLIDNPNKESHLLNKVKFTFFSEFFQEIKDKPFEVDKVIFDYLNIDDKIVLLAINSNHNINQNGGEGYIVVERFKQELEKLKRQFAPEINFICCWHHNFASNYDDSNRGQWDKDNRRYLLTELESQNIKLVLCGNEHTPGSKNLNLKIDCSDCGAFCDTKYHCSFKLYPLLIDTDSIKLANIGYGLQKPDGNDTQFFWNKVENDSAKQVDFFNLLLPNKENIEEIANLPETGLSTPIIVSKKKVIENNIEFNQDLNTADKLYQIVRDKKLFHSGHFHWSDTSRAHNWIDIAKLLEDYKDLNFIKNAIIEIIENHDLIKNCNLIIGLGYEGNLIASKASIKYDVTYSYLPYSYRYKDHHDFENNLNVSNANGEYKNVIIITDVVNDGRTIRKLIGKREKCFFEKVEKIIVISLFYTGENLILSTNMLNSNNDENFDYLNDEKVNNIEFYSIKNIRVDKCPYKEEYKTECLIYKDELSCVHLFYDVKK